MTDSVQEWLPAGAAAHAQVRVKVEAAVAVWSGRWFAGAGAAVADITPVGGPRSDGDGPWRVHGAVVATQLRRAMTGPLMERIFGVRFEGLVPTPADRRLFAALAEKVAGDLAAELEAQGFGTGAPSAPRDAADPFGPLGGALIRVGDGRDTLLSAAIPRDVLARVCKHGLPARSPAPRPANRVDTLGPTAVPLEATLGRAQLTLAELRGLTHGDIVVLDTPLDGGVELSLTGAGAVIGRATLGELGGKLTLTLQSQPG